MNGSGGVSDWERGSGRQRVGECVTGSGGVCGWEWGSVWLGMGGVCRW